MKVKELKELLADAPDDLEVMVAVENHLHPEMFAFAAACPCETGVSTLQGGINEGEGDEEVFLILPHNYEASDKEAEDGKIVVPILN